MNTNAELILAIDLSATTIRCTLFAFDGTTVTSSAHPIELNNPAPDCYELNPEQIWNALLDILADLMQQYDLSQIAAVGIVSQRSHCLLWDKATGEPLGPALAWNDRRTEPFVAALRDAGHALLVQVTTGMPLQGYYSASKLRWLLDHQTGAGGLLAVGQLAGGTLECWLLWRLSNGRTFATDYSNGQRTQLQNINSLQWSPELARLFSVPLDILPKLQPAASIWGRTQIPKLLQFHAPISALASGSAATLIGHGAFEPGIATCTYNNSLTVTLFHGSRPVSTREAQNIIAYNSKGELAYALNNIILGGALALEWCCNRLTAFSSIDELLNLATSATGDDQVIFVPAFNGMNKDQYANNARAAVLGLHFTTDRSSIARAAVESIAFQIVDTFNHLQTCGKIAPTRLLADGRLARSDLLLQLQADLLGLPVERASQADLAALGIAYLAGKGAGLPISQHFLTRGRGRIDRFYPQIDEANRKRRLNLWHTGIERAANWETLAAG